jgi:uncharacterized protein (TIGR02646 family)
MDRFLRTPEPESLQSAHKDLCQGTYVAALVWKRFRQRNAYEDLRSELLHISQDTCAFCAGGFAQSPVTVEHFEPKSGPRANAQAVLRWSNLFPACAACQLEKADGFSDLLLKPDADEYSPSAYFWVDADDGSLKPLPCAGEAVQAQASKTIELYGLDRPPLKKERKQVLKQLQRKSADGDALDEYRFLKELFA